MTMCLVTCRSLLNQSTFHPNSLLQKREVFFTPTTYVLPYLMTKQHNSNISECEHASIVYRFSMYDLA